MAETELKVFYARRNVMASIILMPIIFIITLFLAPDLQVSGVVILVFFFVSIWRYNLKYVEIGTDFISIRPPTPTKGVTTILFDEIETIEMNDKFILIYYCNANNHKKYNFKIKLNFMEDKEQNRLIPAMDIILKTQAIKCNSFDNKNLL